MSIETLTSLTQPMTALDPTRFAPQFPGLLGGDAGPTALDLLATTARTGSPVEAGDALRAMDAMIGRGASDQMVASPPSLNPPTLAPAVLTPEAQPASVQPAVVRDGDAAAAVVPVQDYRSAGRIDLTQHEGRGVPPSHTIALHVGKSRAFLMNMMQPIGNNAFSAYRTRHSTFPSLEAANSLVSATLSQGREVSPGVFYREFSSPTGTAAVRRDMIPLIRPQGRVNFEDAYGVLVVTRPDQGMPGGFRVQTAYPTIPFSGARR